MKILKEYKGIILLFLTALICRLLFFYLQSGRCFYGYALDSQYYLTQADHLVSHHSLSSYEQGPLYPLFLASSFFLFGKNPGIFILLQITLVSAAAVLFFKMALQYFDDIRYAYVAGFLFAADPLLIYFSSFVMTENLLLFLLVLFFYLLLDAWKKEKTGAYALAGFVFGLGLLCRSVIASYIPFLILAGFLAGKWKGLKKTFCILVFAFITILPWEINLYNHFQRFVFIQVKAGIQLYQSLIPYGIKYEQMTRWHSEIGKTAEEQKIMATNDTFLIDKYFKQKSVDWIKNNPGLFAVRTSQKALDYWPPWLNGSYSKRLSIALAIYVSAIYLLCIIGLARYRNKKTWFIIAFIVSAYLPFFVFFPQVRYRMPVHICLLLLAAGSFSWKGYELKNKTTH